MSKSALTVQNLCKRYGEKEVLKGVSLTLKEGEIVALLGPNGAGKTTALECIEGLRTRDSGRVEISGQLGVQLQSSSLPATIRPQEALELFCRWNGGERDREAEAELGIDALGKRPYRSLSTGQKRRLHLALALIGRPSLLFLDEPTAGLDVEGRAALHRQIGRLKERGCAILLASHDMAEVERLCDQIVLLKGGRVAFSGSPSELLCQGETGAQIGLKTGVPLDAAALRNCRFTGEHQGYALYQTQQLSEGLWELLSLARSAGVRVEDVRVEHQSLEDRFLDFAQQEETK